MQARLRQRLSSGKARAKIALGVPWIRQYCDQVMRQHNRDPVARFRLAGFGFRIAFDQREPDQILNQAL